jgi:hypothetical protein
MVVVLASFISLIILFTKMEMKKYVVFYHASKAAMEQMGKKSPEDKSKGMEKWKAWAKNCGESLFDMGTPLANGQKISSSGKSPSDMNVMGYSILQAEDMEKAEAVLKGNPFLEDEGCSLVLYEQIPMPSQ